MLVDRALPGAAEIVASTFARSKPQIVLLQIGTNDVGYDIKAVDLNKRLETSWRGMARHRALPDAPLALLCNAPR